MPFLLILLLLPVLEILVFVEVAGEIGFGTAVLLAILSALVGTAIVRRQGFENFLKLQNSINNGDFPADEFFNAACFFIAGIALIVPGFLSDLLAFLLLVAPVRQYLGSFLRKEFFANPGAARFYSRAYGRQSRVYDPDAIDGEFESVDDAEKDRHLTDDR